MLAVVIVAPLVQHGTTSYADVFGPLIGGVFAFGISRGYVQLLRDANEREQLLASLTRAHDELADMQDELLIAQRQSAMLEERTRISRDLHDTVAQSLSSIRLLSHASAVQDEGSDSSRTLQQVESLAAESLVDIRRIIAALAPAELDEDVLAVALERILNRMREESGIDTRLSVDQELPALATETEAALLRAAQSALANVRLHANASLVVVSLMDSGDSVRLDIVDDGVGFDLDELTHNPSEGSSGFGLRFMKSRLTELGGGLEIESTLSEGTAISIQLPILPARSTVQVTNKEVEEG